MIVVVDIHTIAVPFPIAAAVQIVIRHYPVRIVVEHHAAGPGIASARDKYLSHVSVTPGKVCPPPTGWFTRVLPTAVVGVVRRFPNPCLAVFHGGSDVA